MVHGRSRHFWRIRYFIIKPSQTTSTTDPHREWTRQPMSDSSVRLALVGPANDVAIRAEAVRRIRGARVAVIAADMQSALRGAVDFDAAVVRSAGAANLMNSEAAIRYEEARSRYFENRLQGTETYFEMRRMNRGSSSRMTDPSSRMSRTTSSARPRC